MVEMWDLAHYIEGNPDDHEQRWRLAKKLYMAWEYRLALEHLQVLRNEWDPRVNVARYLAATYYRLGRYTEAINELEAALKTWPGEVGLEEQLARVMEISGDREGAAAVWERVAKTDPHHPIAAKSARRLREKIHQSANDDLHLTDSDDGIDLSPGRACPACGAQNSDEFDRCWQCHAPLAGGGAAPPEAAPAPAPASGPAESPASAETIRLAGRLLVVALLSLGVYLSLMLVLGRAEGEDSTIHTLWQLYATRMVKTRLAAGAVLLLFWPLVLWGVMLFFEVPRDLPNGRITMTGIFLAALAYVCSWIPGVAFFLAFVIPAVAGLVIITTLFFMPFARALGVWAAQYAVMALLVAATVFISESIQLKQFFNPITEFPAVLRYALEEGSAANPGMHDLPGEMVEDALGTRWAAEDLRWRSTGSRWMDRRAGQARFTVTTDIVENKTRFELDNSEGTDIYELVTASPWQLEYDIDTDETYAVYVQEPASSKVSVRAACLLRVDWE